ncbi:large ribosomal subunit protein mL63-like [Rhopilema esculentum]|uniref:large ribosomal subunit protein mL63-like n=1 Tax=Rhopilema esculentum TaxID=499914 RepID=UPI0031CEE76C
MWFTRLLMSARSFPGRIWSGKNRKVRKVTGHMKYNKLQRALLVRQVEEMIATPYLTVEEEHGHAVMKKKESVRKFFEKQNRLKTLGPDVLGLDSLHATKNTKSFLEHINVARKWNPVD